MTFTNRFVIEGKLEAVTPLHVGNGGARKRTGQRDGKSPEGEVATVARCRSRTGHVPCVPASALKALLRREFARRGIVAKDKLAAGESPTAVDELLGVQDLGGKLLFADAVADTAASIAEVPGIAIDRVSRTAADEHLFHRECVAPGTRFSTRITGLNLSEQDLRVLLGVLSGIDGSDVSTVGASARSGLGRVRWHQGAIRVIDRAGAAAWISAGAPVVASEAAVPVDEETRTRLLTFGPAAFNTAQPVEFDVRLQALGPFLVNDPELTGGERGQSHAFRRDRRGRAVLPASSFRGAFRSQAERIVRTIAGRRDAACQPGSGSSVCDAVHEVGGVGELCFACWVLGAAGWASPLSISDFVAEEQAPSETVVLQGVAVDRFTGGAAPGKKFQTEAVRGIRLAGALGLDIGRLAATSKHCAWKDDGLPAALGLLALTLRDLLEGDVRFGFGSSKGYGGFVGGLTLSRGHGDPYTTLARFFAGGVEADKAVATTQEWVAALHRVLGRG